MLDVSYYAPEPHSQVCLEYLVWSRSINYAEWHGPGTPVTKSQAAGLCGPRLISIRHHQSHQHDWQRHLNNLKGEELKTHFWTALRLGLVILNAHIVMYIDFLDASFLEPSAAQT